MASERSQQNWFGASVPADSNPAKASERPHQIPIASSTGNGKTTNGNGTKAIRPSKHTGTGRPLSSGFGSTSTGFDDSDPEVEAERHMLENLEINGELPASASTSKLSSSSRTHLERDSGTRKERPRSTHSSTSDANGPLSQSQSKRDSGFSSASSAHQSQSHGYGPIKDRERPRNKSGSVDSSGDAKLTPRSMPDADREGDRGESGSDEEAQEHISPNAKAGFRQLSQSVGGASSLGKFMKQMHSSGDGSENAPGTGSRAPYGKNSRKSRTGLRGMPKKGGAGGKGVWGRPGSELQTVGAALDHNDPNYDSDLNEEEEDALEAETSEPEPSLSNSDLEARIKEVILEFFEHAKLQDCIEALQEFGYGPLRSHTSSAGSASEDSPFPPSDSPKTNGHSGQTSKSSKQRHASSNSQGSASGLSRKSFIPYLAVTLALEHKSYHCELVSQLLAALVHLPAERDADARTKLQLQAPGHAHGRSFLAQRDSESGFDRVIRELPELVLDVSGPKILPEQVGMFIARAAGDRVIDRHRFFLRYKGIVEDAYARAALNKADLLLSKRLGDSGLERIWGAAGAIRPVIELCAQFESIVREYLSNYEVAEAVRSVRELEVPHYAHELIHCAVTNWLQQRALFVRERELGIGLNRESVRDQLLFLIKALSDAGVLTADQLQLGLTRVVSDLKELALDFGPQTYELIEELVRRCDSLRLLQSEVARKLIRDVLQARPSTGGRRRFASEMVQTSVMPSNLGPALNKPLPAPIAEGSVVPSAPVNPAGKTLL